MHSVTKTSLLRNWTYLLASDVTQQIVGFFVLIILARKLAPEGYGQYSVILSLVNLVAMLANFGMNQVITREIALHPDHTRRLISLIVPARFGSYLLAIAAFLVYFNIGTTEKWTTVLLVAAMVLGMAIWDVCESIAFGYFITKYSSVLNVIASVTWLFAVLVFPIQYLDAQTILFVFTVLLFSKSLWYVGLVRKRLLNSESNPSGAASLKQIVSMSLPYLWLRGVGVLVDQVPILILYALSGAREVGYYSVGEKLILPISLALSTALRAMFPFMTKVYSEDKELFTRRIKEGLTMIACVGAIMAASLSVSSQYWIPLLFGAEYVQSVTAFNFLVWFGVILSADLLLSASLSSSYRQNALAVLATIDAVIAIPMYYLGAMHGALGLASAKFLFGLTVLSYHWVVFSKILNVNMSVREFSDLAAPFFLSMGVCFLSISALYKLLLLLLLFGIYFLNSGSPFRQTYTIAANFVSSRDR